MGGLAGGGGADGAGAEAGAWWGGCEMVREDSGIDETMIWMRRSRCGRWKMEDGRWELGDFVRKGAAPEDVD